MCNFIFHRREGGGGNNKSKPIKSVHPNSRKDFDFWVTWLFKAYENSKDKDMFINKLEKYTMSDEDISKIITELEDETSTDTIKEDIGKKISKKKKGKKKGDKMGEEKEDVKNETEVESVELTREQLDAKIESLESDVKGLEVTLENCSKAEVLLAKEEAIETLTRQLDVYRKQELSEIKELNKDFDETEVENWDVEQIKTLKVQMLSVKPVRKPVSNRQTFTATNLSKDDKPTTIQGVKIRTE